MRPHAVEETSTIEETLIQARAVSHALARVSHQAGGREVANVRSQSRMLCPDSSARAVRTKRADLSEAYCSVALCARELNELIDIVVTAVPRASLLAKEKHSSIGSKGPHCGRHGSDDKSAAIRARRPSQP